MDARHNVDILNDTLDIMKKGYYYFGDKVVKLSLSDKRQCAAVYYDAEKVAAMRDIPKGEGAFIRGRCEYIVANIGSFEAARAMAADCVFCDDKRKKNVLVLNFANPICPGGGVRNGANAQEEDLCRKSSLLRSLESEEASEYYAKHRNLGHLLATDAIILSPEVEIIREEDNRLLPEPVVVAVLTCAAPAIQFEPETAKRGLEDLLYNRIMGILKVAAHEGYDDIVLGAWGCGAFGNDPDMVSRLFHKALKRLRHGRLRQWDVFRRIMFAVLDRSDNQKNFNAFKRRFDRFHFCLNENGVVASRKLD